MNDRVKQPEINRESEAWCCDVCDADVSSEDKICPNCGADLIEVTDNEVYMSSKQPTWTTGRMILAVFFVLFFVLFVFVAFDRGFKESGGFLVLKLLVVLGAILGFFGFLWNGLGKYSAKCSNCRKDSQQYIIKKNKRFLSVECPHCKHSWHGWKSYSFLGSFQC